MDNLVRNIILDVAYKNFSKNAIKAARSLTGLERRTIIGLAKLLNNEPGISDDILKKITDEKFYTLDNMVKLSRNGLSELIPISFYEDEVFVTKAEITELPDGFAKGDEDLERFTIMPGIKIIGNEAFAECENLEDIFFTQGLIRISDGAFRDCYELMIEEIPDSVTYIGKRAFMNCTALYEISVPGKVKYIPDEAFWGCSGIGKVKVDKSVSIGDRAFEDCVNLVRFEGIIRDVGMSAFEGCEVLERVYLRSANISKYAFAGCTSLEGINFINQPYKIDRNAFAGCARINQIIIDGYEYQLRGAKGFKEISKNISVLFTKDGEQKLSCNIAVAKSASQILEEM